MCTYLTVQPAPTENGSLRSLRRIIGLVLMALLALPLITACQSSAPNPSAIFTNTPIPFIISPAPQSPVLFTYRGRSSIAAPIWLPDNRHLAFVSGGSTNGGGSIYVLDVLTKTLTRTLILPVLPSGTIAASVLSPDGSFIVFAREDGKLSVWNTLSGRRVLVYDNHTAVWPLWAWAPDGQRIALASQVVDSSQIVQVWNVATGRELLSFSVPAPNLYDVEWSPDGEHLAMLSRDRTLQLWDSTAGQAIQHFTDPDLSDIRWSPDGHRILSSLTIKRTADTSMRIWNVFTGRKLLTYSGHTSPAFEAQWSADGARIFSLSTAEILIWNASTGKTILRIPLRSYINFDMAEPSPDGHNWHFPRETTACRSGMLSRGRKC